MSSTDSFSLDILHEQAARARKLQRLRQEVDAAQDPADLFEATADLIEAMMDAGASFCSSSETTTAAATPASSCPGQEQVLALTLCAALSEPVLRHGKASSASLASLSGAGSGSLLQSSPSPGRGNTPNDGSLQPSKRRRSPPVAASAGAASQLQTCYSLPYPASTGLELAGHPADSLAAAHWSSADLELRRSLSTAQLEVSTHKPQHSPPRSAHSCLQLRGTLQQQQQLMHNRQSLQELLRQRLLRTASLGLQPQQQQQQQDPLYQQLQYRQQQQIAELQRQAQQELLTLPQHRHGQQQGLGQQVLLQQPATDHNADLLDRLKRAIAVTAVCSGLTQRPEQSTCAPG